MTWKIGRVWKGRDVKGDDVEAEKRESIIENWPLFVMVTIHVKG